MEKLALYLSYLLVVVGGASAVALALKPLLAGLKAFTDKTENTFDNKVTKVLSYLVKGLVWVGEKLLPLLNGLALNPKAPKDPVE